jgi:hypothetical protein
MLINQDEELNNNDWIGYRDPPKLVLLPRSKTHKAVAINMSESTPIDESVTAADCIREKIYATSEWVRDISCFCVLLFQEVLLFLFFWIYAKGGLAAYHDSIEKSFTPVQPFLEDGRQSLWLSYITSDVLLTYPESQMRNNGTRLDISTMIGDKFAS